MSDVEKAYAEYIEADADGVTFEEFARREGYRLLDGHDAGSGEETCDDGCGKQPLYVRLTTGAWVCEDHAR